MVWLVRPTFVQMACKITFWLRLSFFIVVSVSWLEGLLSFPWLANSMKVSWHLGTDTILPGTWKMEKDALKRLVIKEQTMTGYSSSDLLVDFSCNPMSCLERRLLCQRLMFLQKAVNRKNVGGGKGTVAASCVGNCGGCTCGGCTCTCCACPGVSFVPHLSLSRISEGVQASQ